jgi:D-beta-D-heptose 7-phosphate kinase/D-beta-D-heptose 1-phosphate adenosyltransferase
MKVAVLGDLIEDIFLYGTCDRLNPEGPSPLVNYQRTIKRIGGAGNVVENLKNLGFSVDFIHPNTAPSRKTRIVANGQTICRLDEDIISPNLVVDHETFNYDFVIVSDYNKGAVGDCSKLIQQINCAVFVDPKKDFKNYKGAYCIKPNKQEFERFWGPVTEENLRSLAENNNHKLVIVTLGEHGVIYYYEGQTYTIKSCVNQVTDVTGAGDCFMAALVYGFSKGMSVHQAVELGNLGAGVSVTHPGTYILSKNDLIKTKVFTNGCFDILHRGHINLLEASKKMGNYLIVGLNSDASVKRLKGADRPINNQEDRKKALESIKFVDEVVIFDEDTPYELIKNIKPDIITKGGDYKAESVVGHDLAIVKIIPLVQGYSTTKIIGEL